MGILRILCAITLAVLIMGCGETRYVMRYDLRPLSASEVWPPQETQETPRYGYVGELVGEDNFKPVAGGGQFKQAFNWLVGLFEGNGSRVVLQRPLSGLVDKTGRIFVTDMSRKAVFVFDEAKGQLEVWDRANPKTPFLSPVGIALGRDGQLLVTDSELKRVFRFDASGKHLGEFGAGVLQRPTGIARDPVRRLTFVADTYAHNIKVFDDDGRLLNTIGQRGDAAGEFNFPTHLTYSNSALYVTDMMNSRIQVLDYTGEAIMKFGKRGLYVGNLVRPKGVATDDEGNIYVVESMHDTLLVHDRAGRLLLSIGGTGKDAGKFYLPAGVWTDSGGRVFVADMFNGRVAIFKFLGGV